ncbi:MAG: VPLPA-CTERM sorting domain-containing protein [Pseudomonadota bacterium]
MPFLYALPALLAGALVLAVPAPSLAALIVVTDTVNADPDFVALCGGSDNFGCEYAVAQGVAGNRAPDGDTEATIFNRLTNRPIGQQTRGFSDPSSFSLTYDADGGTLGTGQISFQAIGSVVFTEEVDFSTPVAGDNPQSPALSLVLRVARARAFGMTLNGMPLPDLDVLSPVNVGYLYIGGFDVTDDWTITGNIDLADTLDSSATGFQLKVTDLEVVPLPATLPFLVAGLAGLALLRRRAA